MRTAEVSAGMKMRVMARPRNPDEHPSFHGFRRAGIFFPEWHPGMPYGGPVEVTLVTSGVPYPDAFEVDIDGWNAIVGESMLVIEGTDEIWSTYGALKTEAEKRRMPFVAARIVAPGNFDTLRDVPPEIGLEDDAAEGAEDDLVKMTKQDLIDEGDNFGLALNMAMPKGEMIEAVRAARKEAP